MPRTEMSDRDGKSEPSVAPGQRYVEVEYDYEYKLKDKLVSIRQGEGYVLVKKTNEDWWQVRKDQASKPFYVPAQYVREVRKALMPPPKALSAKGSFTGVPGVPDLRRSSESLNKHPEGPASVPDTPPTQRRDGRSGAELASNNNNNSSHSCSTLPRRKADSPPPRVPPHGDSAGEGSGDDLSNSSTEHLQTGCPADQRHPESPVYANLQELKISQTSQPPQPSCSPLQVAGDWETHRDGSGRHFYYNRSTQERTWKPPRSRGDPHGSGEGETPSISLSPHCYQHAFPEKNSHRSYSSGSKCSRSGSQSDSQYGSLHGWSEELDWQGNILYVSEFTNEKWMKHVDEQGRLFYYNTDGSRSEWELPKSEPLPPHPGDASKSRSLDRKQPEAAKLSKWRHSTVMLEANEKLPGRHRPSRSGRHAEVVGAPEGQEHETEPKLPPDLDPCPSSPRHPTSPSEKSAVLNVTKITEHGKKVRKNWTSSWTSLQGFSLVFAKAQGSGTSWKFGGSQSKPEFTVDLRGGSVDWASKDKSSKKNVLEVKTRQGTDLLIQQENDITDWHKALAEAISNHPWESDEAIEEDLPESPGVEKEKEKEHRDSKKNRAVKNSNSMDSSDPKKTRVNLKKFLIRRPTLQAVRDKGYIKDQVFGCSLISLCSRQAVTVPNFVRLCIEHVEKNGLNVDGLYRVSGNLAVIQKLRFAINHDEQVDLDSSKWEDVHVTTGALKMFFRELPEPLFTFAYFNDFVSAIKCPDYKQRVHSVKTLIKQLPKPNQDTMQALFKHLRKVIEHGEENRMTTQSVAIVFGPTLLRPEIETANIAVYMVYQNQIVELILLEYQDIFGR